jgi:hypothetical protein
MSDITSANLPYPLLVNATTGNAGPALPLENIAALPSDLPGADQRIANSTHLGTDYSVDDPNDLTQTGWGILFASDADPAIQAQLQPLLDLRKQQVQDPALFKIFSGNTGVLPGQSAANWAQQRGVSLTAPVDPFQGVPYYLLIAGSPERISFEFQALLKMQWAVGRLYFDDVADYSRYAQAVFQYENKSFAPVQRKNAAVWVPRNYGDLATAMLSGVISEDFLASANQLGARRQFTLDAFTSEKATKTQLIEILRGNVPGGPPAVIFTGSHGCDYTGADPATQRRLQGSLVTQEWIPKTPANSTNQFSADDIPSDAKLLGAVGFLFACFSGACPAENNYYFNPDGTPISLAPAPIMARLPQALLSRGMLAVIGHIDMAFPYAFQDVNGTPQVQAVRTPLELLMSGKRVGLAADSLSVMWSARSSQLALATASNPSAPAPAGAAASSTAASSTAPSSAVPSSTAPVQFSAKALAQMTIARDDARNYIVLGDPATQLRVRDLK